MEVRGQILFRGNGFDGACRVSHSLLRAFASRIFTPPSPHPCGGAGLPQHDDLYPWDFEWSDIPPEENLGHHMSGHLAKDELLDVVFIAYIYSVGVRRRKGVM